MGVHHTGRNLRLVLNMWKRGAQREDGEMTERDRDCFGLGSGALIRGTWHINNYSEGSTSHFSQGT